MSRKVTAKEVSRLPTSQPFISAAGFLATITYPLDWEKRTKFLKSSMAWELKRTVPRGILRNDSHHSWDEIKGIRPRDYYQFFKTFEKKWVTSRAIAAYEYVHILDITRLKCFRNYKFHSHTWGVFDKESNTYTYDSELVKFQSNAVRDIWIQSLPILHLCVPLYQIFGFEVSAESLLSDWSWLNDCVNRAESLRINMGLYGIAPLTKTISLLPDKR